MPVYAAIAYITNLPNLNLKTQPKLLLGYLPLAITLLSAEQPCKPRLNLFVYYNYYVLNLLVFSPVPQCADKP